MTAVVWPFKQVGDIIESLEWLTDVFRAKSAEQRIALRSEPRRIYNISHILDDRSYAAARALIRLNQGADGFYIPDWPQSSRIGPVSSGSSVSLSVDLSYVHMGAAAILWESSDLFEQVDITNDSNGVTLATVVNNYSDARLVPVFLSHCPQGLSTSRGAAQINRCSAAFNVYENSDLASTSYPQYRSHDIMTSCPIIGSGDFSEDIGWPVSAFDNQTSIPHYLQQRTIPDMQYQMRWHEFTAQSKYELRQWLHSRRGRQKVFWLSSRAQDLEPAAAISGTTATIYTPPGLTALGQNPFDIDITDTAGTSNYRRVTSYSTGTPVNGRDTLDMTIDSTLTVSDIKRISFLRCTRFDADRIELNHTPGAGMSVQVPCIEVPEP